MDYPKIDWSDLENIEPVPGGRWDGWKVIGHYRSIDGTYPNLLVLQDKDCRLAAVTFTDDGRLYIDDIPCIRNKPKRVKLQEVWVVYTPEGVRVTGTGYSDTAADYAKRGYIVRHIPAEEREV